MFGIVVELLSGRYVATAYNDRERVEWPPHPARLFSALVEAWADAEHDSSRGARVLAALRWLERQDAPEILASSIEQTAFRTVLPVYVPVNDVAVVTPPNTEKLADAEAALIAATDAKTQARAEKLVAKLQKKLAADTAKAIDAPSKLSKADLVTAEQLVTDRRTRQPRTFPSSTPACSKVGFLWSCAEPSSEMIEALEELSSRIVRLGHSSSLVRVGILGSSEQDDLRESTTCYQPDEDEGEMIIRWVAPGQVERLSRAFELHRETEPRVLPARFVRYRMGERRAVPAPLPSSFSGDFIVFRRVGGPRLPITSVVGIARQFRRALLASAEQPVPELISGHRPDGTASDSPHVAIVPLPLVTGPHPDGAVLGLAMVLPRVVSDEHRAPLVRAVARLEQTGRQDDPAGAPTILLRLGDAGVLELQRVEWGEDSRVTLRTRTWCRPSRRWASATPVALDRNPGDLHDSDPEKRRKAFDEATDVVVQSVERIGLPRPIEVDVVRSCVLRATAKPRSYPRFPIDRNRPQRVLVHVRLVFGDAVRGPLLLGAGRYQGLGLFLPVDDRGVGR